MIRMLFLRFVRIFWLLPGFLLWASFPPMGETADCLFALAPLLWLARNRSPKENFRRWFLSGLVFWIATLSWMPAIVKNGGPWPLVVLGWGALAAYCALFFGASGWMMSVIWTWAKDDAGRPWRAAPSAGCLYLRRLFALLVAEPLVWAGFECARSRLFGGFAWNQLGVAPIVAGFSAPAALGGVYLVSALVVLVNGTVAGIAERMLEPFLAARGKAFVSPVPRWLRSIETVIPLLLIWSVFRVSATSTDTVRSDRIRPLGVALLQRNFPCVFKGAEASPLPAYDRLCENVGQLAPDLVVLSESALCEFGPIGSIGAESFARRVISRTGACAALIGGGRRTEDAEYNSAALYAADGTLQVYDKVHLVPFGEYIPGDKLFPALQRFAPVGSCTPGSLGVLTLPGEREVRFGVAICYEDTDSAQQRQLAAMGAQMLVFITNDSWFSQSIEAEQHAWQAVARAVETGLPVVRVGNSGVTGVIASNGRANWLVDDGRPVVDRAASMFDHVVPSDGMIRTPYVRVGDMPLVLAFLLLIITVIVVKYKDTYEKRRNMSL